MGLGGLLEEGHNNNNTFNKRRGSHPMPPVDRSLVYHHLRALLPRFQLKFHLLMPTTNTICTYRFPRELQQNASHELQQNSWPRVQPALCRRSDIFVNGLNIFLLRVFKRDHNIHTRVHLVVWPIAPPSKSSSHPDVSERLQY
jgi:hypothetical protein